jgi:hydrogenase nickel incorporation protein HypA/HybF
MGRHPGSRLHAIHLVVGQWSGAEPESLEFALGLVMAESEWPQAAVHIRREPLGLVCRRCDRDFEPEKLNLACPACASTDSDVVRGKDVRLESLEIE